MALPQDRMLHKSPPFLVAGVIALGLLLGCFIHPEVSPVIETNPSFFLKIHTVGIHHILPGRLPLFFSGAFVC